MGAPLFSRTTRSVALTDLTVEITQDDGLVDIVGGGVDAGVRLGEMIAEDMVAVRLTPPFKAIMVAAPPYLEAKGEPKTLADLRQHSCIGYRLISTGAIYGWDLLDEGRDVSVQVSGPVRVPTRCWHASWHLTA